MARISVTRSFAAVLLLVAAGRAADLKVGDPPKPWGLDPFYKKCVEVNGLPIVSSAKVSDYALKEAAYLVDRMLAGRRDLIDVMVENRVHVAVISYSERTVDVPEHRDMKPAATGIAGPGAWAARRPVAARRTCSTIPATHTTPRTSSSTSSPTASRVRGWPSSTRPSTGV